MARVETECLEVCHSHLTGRRKTAVVLPGRNRFDAELSRVRCVSWDPVVIIHQLDDAEEDRHSAWMFFAVDRARFRKRIENASVMLGPILTRKREIYLSRAEDCKCDILDSMLHRSITELCEMLQIL